VVKFFDKERIDLSEFIKVKTIMVDALGVGDVGGVVLRDRKVLAEEGIFVVVVVVDQSSFEIVGEPEIVTRGFVYLGKSQEFLKRLKEFCLYIKRKEETFVLS